MNIRKDRGFVAQIKTHCEDTLLILRQGYDFIEVHEWIDEFAKKWPPHIHFEYHRKFRHNKKGLEEIFKKWGADAEDAGKVHLIRDVELFILQKPMFEVKYNELNDLIKKAFNYL